MFLLGSGRQPRNPTPEYPRQRRGDTLSVPEHLHLILSNVSVSCGAEHLLNFNKINS